MPSKLEVVLFLHITGVLAFVSGIAVAAVGFGAARRRDDPGEIAVLLGVTRTGVLLVAVGTLMILGFGLWLVHIGHFGYGSGWIVASLILFVLALALGGAGGRRPKQARLLAKRLAEDQQPVTPELRALLDDRLSSIVNYASSLMMLAILALMVTKP